jgi:hypothetical protein
LTVLADPRDTVPMIRTGAQLLKSKKSPLPGTEDRRTL